MKCSLVFNVLESYEVVKRQALLYERILPEDFEVIFVDDGSQPPLEIPSSITKNIKVIATKDFRPWTQAVARNLGARSAQGDYILFCDIDHFITEEILEDLKTFEDDKMEFSRTWGVLNEDGTICTDKNVLFDYGLPKREIGKKSSPYNIFAIKKSIFVDLGGYNEKFAGRYGSEDVDFSGRYGKLHREGGANRSIRGKTMYVYPDPRRDVKKVFHSLRR